MPSPRPSVLHFLLLAALLLVASATPDRTPKPDPAQTLLATLESAGLSTHLNNILQTLPRPAPTQVDHIVAAAENEIAQRGDAKLALRLFRLAGALGHYGALSTAAALLLGGDAGLPRDVPAAVRHLRYAARHGQPDAQALLGFLHASGLADRHGVRKSVPAALLHWTFAAASGNIYATTALAFRYLHGLALPRSCPAAARYYHKAAQAIATDQRHWPSASNFLDGKPPLPSTLTDSGRLRLDENMLRGSPPDVVSDDADLIQFYRHSAERGDTAAMTTLGGLHYFGGYGLEPDERAARDMLERAAAQNGGEAHGMLGHFAMRERRNHTAYIHFRRSAGAQSKIGHYALGMVFLHGLLGHKADYSKAAMHFELAAEQKHPEASFHLGLLHWRGKGVDLDLEKAYRHFQDGARLGNIQSKLNVGTILLEGSKPVKRPDCERAVKFLKEVAEEGEWKTVFELAISAMDSEEWYTTLYRHMQAAHAGIEIAQHNAAMLLELVDSKHFPELVHWDRERTLSEAHELYESSGIQGHTDSLIRSGNVRYIESEDYTGAARVYEKASDLKNAEGMVTLSIMHARGLGVPMDREKAVQYLHRASAVDSDASAPASIALFGLRSYWFLTDVWNRIATASPERRVERVSGKRAITAVGEAPRRSSGVGLAGKLEIEELALMGALFAVLLAVLVVRSKRIARQHAEQLEQEE